MDSVSAYFMGLLDGFQCMRSLILILARSGGLSVGATTFIFFGLFAGGC